MSGVLTVKSWAAVIGAWVGYLFGAVDGLLYALIVFVVLDYATGVMRAIAERKLSSDVGFKGIFRKMIIFALVIVGNVIDTQVLENGSVMRTAVIFFYMSNEGISILENASALGLPVPKKIQDILKQLKEEKEE